MANRGVRGKRDESQYCSDGCAACRSGIQFFHAEELIRSAAAEKPDVICLPETWNTGFFPRENLEILSDRDGVQVKKRIGSLAKELGVHIVAGSVANVKGDGVYNTAYIFNREGSCIAEYDKTHLFYADGRTGFL